MNILPLIGFIERQHGTISMLLRKGSGGKGTEMFLNFVNVNAPLVIQYWPQLNENGLVDDFVKSINAAFPPDAPPS